MADARDDTPWDPRWLGRMAHDLRNELVPLRTATDLLALGRLDPERQREMVSMIERHTRRLVRMLDDVSEYGRQLSGNARAGDEAVELALVIDNAVAAADARLRAAGHELELDVPSEPIHVRGDARRLTQALQRLLDNAIRFTPDGGRIGIALQVEPAHAAIRITDSGPGIPAERRASLFAPPVEQHASEILGLSLLLARACALDHGGDLTLADSDAPGTCFVLRLPRARD